MAASSAFVTGTRKSNRNTPIKLTLLDMVQQILSSMDSDEVNSISDTTESLQVANIIKMKYHDIVNFGNLPEHYDLFELEPSGSSSKPTIMYLPETVDELLWVKYNKPTIEDTALNLQPVTFMPLKDFLERMYDLDPTEDNILSYSITRGSGASVDILAINDKNPDYYTVVDNRTMLFDSYQADVDSTLTGNKTLAYGLLRSVFTLEDSFIPPITDRMFSILYNEAKALCFAELKQTNHADATRSARRGWIHLEKSKRNAPTGQPAVNRLPNYGRK